MRLLFFISSLPRGGAQKQMVALAVEMKRRGHVVEFSTYHRHNMFASRLDAADIPVHCDPLPRSRRLQTVWQLRRRMKSGGYDVVLAYLLAPSLYAAVAGAGLRKRPLIVVSERSSPHGTGPKFGKELVERSYRWADHLVLNSHHLRLYFVNKYRWLAGNATTIWNGVDLAEHPPATFSPQGAHPLRLLALGAVLPNKNWLTLAEAVAALRNRGGPRVCVTHAGTSDPNLGADRAYAQRLHETITRLGLQDQWTFTPESGDVAGLLQQHDALVHPSLVEGLPNVVCEALACGRPVLVSDLFDHPRLVADGETGFLFDARSPQSVAATIERFAALHAGERADMGRRARMFAERHLSIERCASEYEQLFKRLQEQTR